MSIASANAAAASQPQVTTLAATGVTGTAATLNATVNPEGTPVTECEFQWGTSAGVFTHWTPCNAAPGSGTNPVNVSASLANLVPGTSYHYRVWVWTASGTVTSTELRVATASSGGAFTFGNGSLGGQSGTFAANMERVNPDIIYATGVAKSMSIYLQPTRTRGVASVQMMVYADANGAPGPLVGRTVPFLFFNVFKPGWYTLPMARSLTVTPGQYWIGVITGGTSNVAGFLYDDAGTRDTRNALALFGPTDPFGATGQDTAVMSLYANLVPPAGSSAAQIARARSATLNGHARLRIAKVNCARECVHGTPH